MTDKVKVQKLIETTNWDKVAYAQPNHTYFLDASTKKLVAYIKEGTDELIRFSKGIRFERGRRTFNVSWRYI